MDSAQALSKAHQPFFVEIDKLILKFLWKFKGYGIAKTILISVSKMSFAVFYVIGKDFKQPKHPSIGKWLK